MNRQLELEADLWSVDIENVHPVDSYIAKKAFIAGATSKWVEKQKLDFAIEQLKKIKIAVSDKNPFTVYNIAHQIQELEQQLSEL